MCFISFHIFSLIFLYGLCFVTQSIPLISGFLRQTRFLFGIAQGAAGLIMCILLSEILGASKRGVYLMVLQLTFAVGICTFAAIGYFVRDWQHLSLLTYVCVYVYVCVHVGM